MSRKMPMKKKYLFPILLIIASAICVTNLQPQSDNTTATEIIYVTKTKVQIKEGPDEATYKTVGEAKYRDILEVLEFKNDWYKVKVIKSNLIGWIYKGKVSKQKPSAQKSAGETMGSILRGGSGSETTETAAAAGIRDFNAQNYSGLKGDFDSVRTMEERRKNIADKDVIEFLKQGNLK